MTDKKTTSQLQTELDTILEWFESDKIDIDAAVVKYQQGLKLIGQLQERLTSAENAIKKVIKT